VISLHVNGTIFKRTKKTVSRIQKERRHSSFVSLVSYLK